jgi:hypothetical protein
MSIQTIGVRSVFAARISRPAMWLVAAAVIMLCCGMATRDAGATTIDDFSQPTAGTEFFFTTAPVLPAFTSSGNPVVVSNTNSLSLVDNVSPSAVIGGQRRTTINVGGGPLTLTSAEGLIGHDLSPGGLDAMQIATNGTTQATVTSTYLQGGASPAIDLTSGGTQKAIDITVLSTDQPLGITVNLDNFNTGMHWTAHVTAPVNASSTNTPSIPENVIIPFSSFAGPALPGAGTSVNQISFVYNGGASPLANIDFTVGAINTTSTPEPASCVLLVFGLAAVVGLGYRQSRRRTAARLHS